ncbi:MAG: cytochrome P450 [Nostoc sp.]|uniref:cytochrome P450 n=1 Tax=Nostoc sp. TaxID=1180 RepID=UPI002FF6BFB0
MNNGNLFAQVLKQENRHNPYPLYAQLRETPVSIQDDGTYVVSTYAEIRSLLFDPRVSSDEEKNLASKSGSEVSSSNEHPNQDEFRSFPVYDPPDHDRLRSIVVNQFTAERIYGLRSWVEELVKDELDKSRERDQIDIVDDFAYPLPVTVICKILGIPFEDEEFFHEKSTVIATSADPDPSGQNKRRSKEARSQLGDYLHQHIKKLRQHPGKDLLSAIMASGDLEAGRISEQELVAMSVILLIGGHETTVNLITNGMLTLLRYPEHLERLRQDPDLAPRFVQEVLRFEPPVQFRTRTTLADIEIAGTVIPKGVPLVLMLASGNRDPLHFNDPDRFDPDRQNNQHFSFGGSLHLCIGAPLARMEGELAFRALAQRLQSPRLIEDVLQYRQGASLRGPKHLLVKVDAVIDA